MAIDLVKDQKTMVEVIKDPDEKRSIARTVLEALTEWFEVEMSLK